MTDPGNIHLNIEATDQSKPAFDSATASVSKLDASAAKANKTLKELGQARALPPVSVEVRTAAIAKAKADIDALRNSMAKGLSLGLDTSRAAREISQLQRSIKAMEDKPVEIPISVGSVARTNADLGRLRTQIYGVTSQIPGVAALLGTGGLLAASGLAAAGVAKIAGNFEQLQASLSAVLGSKDAAISMLRDLRGLSATTPLKLDDLTSAAKILTSFGVPAGKVVADVRALGDAAAVSGSSVSDLALIWQQMVGFGSVDTQDMRQFIDRGIDFWGALGAAMGKSAEEAKKLSDEGKVGADQLQNLAFGLGSVYQGKAAQQADTFNGKLIKLSDSVSVAADSIGRKLMPEIDNLLAGFSKVISFVGGHAGLAAIVINLGLVAGAAKTVGLTVNALGRAWQNAGKSAAASTAIQAAGLASESAAAGVGRFAVSAEKAATTGGKLFNILKTGLNLFGGIPGIIGGLAVGAIELFASSTNKAADAQQRAAGATADWTKALDLQAGVLDENSRRVAATKLNDAGLLKNLTDLGVATSDAVTGILGNKTAVDAVTQSLGRQADAINAQLDAMIASHSADRTLWSKDDSDTFDALKTREELINKTADAYKGLVGDTEAQATADALLAQAMGTSTAAMDDKTRVLTDLAFAASQLKGGADDVTTMFEEWNGGLRLLIPNTATAAQAQEIMNRALDDQASKLSDANSQLQTYIDRLHILKNETIDSEKATLDFKNSIDAALKALQPDVTTKDVKHTVRDPNTGEWKDVTEQVKVIGAMKTGFGDTEIGRTNMANFLAFLGQAKLIVDADIKMGKSKKDTLKDWDAQKQVMLDAIKTMGGLTDAQAKAMLNAHISTDLEISQSWDANIAKVQKTKAELSKPVNVVVTPYFLDKGDIDRFLAKVGRLPKDITVDYKTDPVGYAKALAYNQALADEILVGVNWNPDENEFYRIHHAKDELGQEVTIPVKPKLDASSLATLQIQMMLALQKIQNASAGQGFVPNSQLPHAPSTPGRGAQEFEATTQALIGAPRAISTPPTSPAGGASGGSVSTMVSPTSTIVNVHVNDQRYRDLLDVHVSQMVGTTIRRLGATRQVTTG